MGDDPTQPLPPPPPTGDRVGAPALRPARADGAWTPPPRRRRGGTVALVVITLVALAATAVAGVQTVRLRDARDEAAALEQRVAELEDRIDALESSGAGGAGVEGLLDGLLDDPALQDLLDGLLGQGGGLDDLLGQGGLEGLLDGGLEDLLGQGGLGDVLGGLDLGVAACVGAPTPGSSPLPADPEAAIAAIADQVAQLRELDFTEPVDPELLPADALADRVMELTREDYTPEDADLDARLLTALGAIPPGTDLRALTLDLLGEQVAGFYDPETGELVALDGGSFDPTTRITLAHELDHALTDQALGLPDLADDDLDADAGLAATAVLEGDATLLMQRWAGRHLSLSEQLGAGGDPAAAQQLAGVPHVLRQQLLFSYLEGMSFVCDAFRDGGWSAVDGLYDTLPTTSAQILWPERYRDGEGAVDVTDPGAPAGDWEQRRTDTLGAADLLWLFEAPGDDRSRALARPQERAAAWAGGEVALWTRGADTAVAVVLAQRDGEDDLCTSAADWYRAAFPAAADAEPAADERLAVDGPSQDAVIACPGDEVRIGIAPDLTTARTLVR